jgi:RHS repeat-associated protein
MLPARPAAAKEEMASTQEEVFFLAADLFPSWERASVQRRSTPKNRIWGVRAKLASQNGSAEPANSKPVLGMRGMSTAKGVRENGLLQWNGQLFAYDLNGNMTSDGMNTLTWDARGQLTQFNTTSFRYDAFGRRTENAAGTKMLYDGSDSVQELSGTTPIANRITGGIDDFFSRTDGTGSYTPLTDAIGSVIGLVNSSGSITTQYTYDPFGVTTASGAASNTFQYTGRENDGTGLYYYRARYYNPLIGRFISEDPLGFRGGGPNFYGYVGNDPINFSDPTGLGPAGTATGTGIKVVVKVIVLGAEEGADKGLLIVEEVGGSIFAVIDYFASPGTGTPSGYDPTCDGMKHNVNGAPCPGWKREYDQPAPKPKPQTKTCPLDEPFPEPKNWWKPRAAAKEYSCRKIGEQIVSPDTYKDCIYECTDGISTWYETITHPIGFPFPCPGGYTGGPGIEPGTQPLKE